MRLQRRINLASLVLIYCILESLRFAFILELQQREIADGSFISESFIESSYYLMGKWVFYLLVRWSQFSHNRWIVIGGLAMTSAIVFFFYWLYGFHPLSSDISMLALIILSSTWVYDSTRKVRAVEAESI